MPPSSGPRKVSERTSTAQDAYARLVAEIRSGTLRPGARLTETELATRFGISRTPVREAIRQLEAEGLVVHQPRVGAALRALDYAEVTELYEMRAVLEGTAARLAARAASQVELAELGAINEDMAAATGNAERLYHLNKQFHAALLDAAKNRFLVAAMGAIHKTMLILGPSTMEEAERAAAALGEHRQVLDALAARDGGSAEMLMRGHIEAAQRVRLRQFRARSMAGPPP